MDKLQDYGVSSLLPVNVVLKPEIPTSSGHYQIPFLLITLDTDAYPCIVNDIYPCSEFASWRTNCNSWHPRAVGARKVNTRKETRAGL